jgi:hypothetical protein
MHLTFRLPSQGVTVDIIPMKTKMRAYIHPIPPIKSLSAAQDMEIRAYPRVE